MKVSFTSVLLLLASACAHAPDTAGQKMPAEFRHARVFVTPALPSGETIEFYTDTGGGWNAVAESVAGRLALVPGEPIADGEQETRTVEFPVFDPARSIPAPPAYVLEGRLAVAPESMLHGEGFLGGRWFADRVWLFDYPAETLHLLERADAWPGARRAELGFQVKDGKRTLHFPRIAVEVDGETLPLLLDTGATVTLAAGGAQAFELPEGTQVAGSFITKSVFERWQARHPDWLVVEAGDAVQGRVLPMIRVPEVRIAGIAAGPVWFAQRPDRAFVEWMSGMMDAPIVGAIGGSAFQYYRMMIDYPGAQAFFSRD